MAVNEANLNKKSSKYGHEEFVGEPLDQMLIPVKTRDGTRKLTPALSIGFMETRSYVNYKLLPCLVDGNKDADELEIEEWLERMAYLEADLSWLLRLRYQRFWCQVLYDSNLHACLQSYLSRCPRHYALNSFARPDILSQHQTIHKLVFFVFLRMSTYKESKFHHITSQVFGELIYDSFIFDIPRIMDLCVLYGFDNPQIISKIVHNLFNTQPSYLADLEDCMTNILMVLDSIKDDLGLRGAETTQQKLLRLEEESPLSMLHLLPLPRLENIINCITDLGATLFRFIEAFLMSSSIFYKFEFLSRIPSFYNLIFPVLEKELKQRQKLDKSEKVALELALRKVALAKSFFVKFFRNIIAASCIDLVFTAKCQENNDNDSSVPFHLENFLNVISGLITYTVFLRDYNLHFPFSSDLEIFAEAGVEIDVTCLNYVLGSVENVEVGFLNSTAANVSNHQPNEDAIVEAPSDVMLPTPATEPVINGDVDFSVQGATPSKPDEIQILSLIQGVLDVLPDFGNGFIEKCLEYYNYDAERVVDALITNELPKILQELPTDLKRKQEGLSSEKDHQTGLDNRRSIFDDDEFDVFSRQDVARDRIRKGKSGKTPKNYAVLAQDEESTFLKELTLAYEQTIEEEEENDPYNDEYDDTYDSQPVCLAEQQPENELLRIRPFRIPNVVKAQKGSIKGDQEGEDSSDEEEDVDEEETGNIQPDDGLSIAEKPLDFCINPEILREKSEARWQAKQATKYANQKPKDDSSKPKSFKNKERHKGQAANHNRRNQSDFKKSRGMMR